MADRGWIKLYRQIMQNDFWNERPFSKGQAWVELLLLANHEDNTIRFNGRPMEVKRGQHLTSLRKLADRWGWSMNKVKRFLHDLEADGMVEIGGTQNGTQNGTASGTQNGTLLTVVKYDVFQVERHSERHAEEHTERHEERQQTRNNKNYKNDKNTPFYNQSFDMEEWDRWVHEGEEDGN